MKPKIKHTFTQEEAEQMYTMLYTLVYALKDIMKNGLTVDTVAKITRELAVFFKSLERVVTQAEKLLNAIDDDKPATPEPPLVQEIEDKLLKKSETPGTCVKCGKSLPKEVLVCPVCGHDNSILK